MPMGEVSLIEEDSPGYIAERIAVRSSYINSRLRKRYGNSGTANSLPLGQSPPILIPSDSTNPQVGLTGRPAIGSIRLVIAIEDGTHFKWSLNGGSTYTTGVVIAPLVPLVGTGISAVFPSGTYSLGMLYAADTPVPEAVLAWLTTFVTWDAYRRRGMNPQDPTLEALKGELDTAMAELKEAADSKDGLFDLPTNEDADSAVTTGFVLGAAQQSPYTWTVEEAQDGHREDAGAIRLNGKTII